MSRRRSLRFLVSFGILGVFSLIVLLSSWYSITLQLSQHVKNIEAEGNRSIVNLTRDVELYLPGERHMLEEEIGQLSTSEHLINIAIFSDKDKVLHANSLSWLGKGVDGVLNAEEISLYSQAKKTRYSQTLLSADGLYVLVMMSYVVNTSEHHIRSLERGVAYLKYDLGQTQQDVVSNALKEHITEFLLVVIGALVLSWFFHLKVVKPLEEMRRVADKISRNNFVKIDNAGSYIEEIHSLQHALNFMSQQLSEKIDMLAEQAGHTLAIIDSMLDAMITTDEYGTINSFNRVAEQLFGYKAEDVIGKNISILMPIEHATKHDEYVANYAQSGMSRIIGIGRELPAVRSNGEIFPIELSLSEVRYHGQRQYMGIIRDISERKQVEKLKSEFISTVSHELRTPLTAISGALSLVNSGTLGALPDKAEPLMTIAANNCQRLLFLINDLLDMEKLLAGKMVFDMQVQPLRPILQQVIESNSTYGLQNEVRIVLDVQAADVMVMVDAQRLMQVLSNFLSNAVKFSPKGEQVVLRVEKISNRVRVSVIDRGPGISDEFKVRIFQKFSQEDSSATRHKGGTGLGLAISKELIEKMNGKIGFESVEGQGSSFYFTLTVEERV